MAALLEYKCPCCHGAINFDSGIQKMKCPYCDTEFDVEALKEQDEVLQEDDLQWDTEGQQWDESDEMRRYVCNFCGGEILTEATTAATSCPYCDNPVVMSGNLAGDLRPDYVIPFKLDKEAAKKALQEHLQGKRLLPNVFKQENHIDEIKGVYVPFWLFAADADADVRFHGKKVRSWSSGNTTYTETSHYRITRAGSLGFDNVPVDGSSKMPDDLMESLEPFHMDEAVDFQTAYLAGYLADKYDVSVEESIQRANERIKRSAEEAMRNTVNGYTSVETESSFVSCRHGKSRYALYPVWLLHTTWNGQKFTFAMNGQTGKFVGNLPMDRTKFWSWLIGLGIGCAGVAYGLAWLINRLL